MSSALEAYRAAQAERERLVAMVQRAADRLTEMERAVAEAEAAELAASERHTEVLEAEIGGTASAKDLAEAVKAVTAAEKAAKAAEAAVAPVEAVLAKAKADLAAHQNRMDVARSELVAELDRMLTPRCLAAWDAAYQTHADRLAMMRAIGTELTGQIGALELERREIAGKVGLGIGGALVSYLHVPDALAKIEALLSEVPREP